MVRTYLNARSRLAAGRTFWVRHQQIMLPYHRDGDHQELYYHLYGNEWWNAEIKAIGRYVSNGCVAIDVGANLGFVSGILSTLIGDSGHVFSFEPSPQSYAKLTEVIQRNRFNNISPYNFGCGAEEGQMTLFYPESSGHATLRPDETMKKSDHKEQKVRIVKLDDFLGARISRLDFIKIDTEGFEDEVLTGAANLIHAFSPVIYIELCSDYSASSQRAVSILRKLGYSFDREVDLEDSHNGDNYFAIPNQKPDSWRNPSNSSAR
jgi:FkbM family methyltransferase